jgi:hypothetical protein
LKLSLRIFFLQQFWAVHLAPVLLSGLMLSGLMPPGLMAQTAPAAPATAPAAQSSANQEFLTSAAKLYYSTSKAGLNSFQCSVHRDWHAILAAGAKGAAVAPDDRRVTLLNSVSMVLHAKLKGGSTLDWNAPTPAKPLDADSVALLDRMHQASDQTLQGFLQFWTPFVDGSVIPESPEGVDIAATDKGHILHADQGNTSLTEVFDTGNILKEFNVVMSGAKINFSPVYKPTDKGLLVNGFQAKVLPAGVPAELSQDINVVVDYQDVGGFPVPQSIQMDVVGTGKLDFTLDHCAVNPAE